jgi:hypothetical protein
MFMMAAARSNGQSRHAHSAARFLADRLTECWDIFIRGNA